MRIIIAAVFLPVMGMLFSGCSLELPYTSRPSLEIAGRTNLTVGVYDFSDLTEGNNGCMWDDGAVEFTNLPQVFADITCDILRDCGYFAKVERVHSAWSASSGNDYDIAVVGEISKFQCGGEPHPTVFINPIELLFLVGVPVGYGPEGGQFTAKVSQIATNSRIKLADFTLHDEFYTSFKGGISYLILESIHKRRGTQVLGLYERQFQEQLTQRLTSGLDRQILALDAGLSPVDSSQLAGIQAAAAPLPTEGRPTVSLKLPEGPVKSRVAVVVGISDYRFRGYWALDNLRYAASDAEHIAQYLASPQGGRFDEVIVLTDEQATTANIRQVMRERLRSIQRDDFVVVYWSGHGSPDPHELDSLYFITHDTDPEHMASTAYSMEEFRRDVARLESDRVLVLADACHSAGVSDPSVTMRGPGDNKIVEQVRAINVAAKPRPVDDGSNTAIAPMRMIFTSCESGELSRESSRLGDGHGVFTWFMLQALEGSADRLEEGGNGDGTVSLGELVEFTRDKVKRFTGNQQHPDTAGRFDRSIPMGKVGN